MTQQIQDDFVGSVKVAGRNDEFFIYYTSDCDYDYREDHNDYPYSLEVVHANPLDYRLRSVYTLRRQREIVYEDRFNLSRLEFRERLELLDTLIAMHELEAKAERLREQHMRSSWRVVGWR